MEALLVSDTNSATHASNKSAESFHMIAASAPIVPIKSTSEALLKIQLSAPSYLHSLKENDAPPFRKPGKEPRTRLIIGTIITEDEVIEMIAASDSDKQHGITKFLGSLLVSKKVVMNYNLPEKNFLLSFLEETTDYAAQREYGAFKLSVLLTIYLDTHLYFKWYYWQSTVAVWYYFKELMIRHTIEDSPDGQEVFEPEECYDITSHFHTLYLTNLPLIHIITFGSYRLKFLWPFKPK